jgi:formylmethanofuran dehydrogenase subunit E
MKMKIHLLDTEKSPSVGSIVCANCGGGLKFWPINADLNDSKICKNCLEVHDSLLKVPAKHTFALKNFQERR